MRMGTSKFSTLKYFSPKINITNSSQYFMHTVSQCSRKFVIIFDIMAFEPSALLKKRFQIPFLLPSTVRPLITTAILLGNNNTKSTGLTALQEQVPVIRNTTVRYSSIHPSITTQPKITIFKSFGVKISYAMETI